MNKENKQNVKETVEVISEEAAKKHMQSLIISLCGSGMLDSFIAALSENLDTVDACDSSEKTLRLIEETFPDIEQVIKKEGLENLRKNVEGGIKICSKRRESIVGLNK